METLVNEKSTHVVEVVNIELQKHPNSDNLSYCKIYDYTVVVNTKQWEGINRAAYVPPDSIVDTSKPEFAWLNEAIKTDEAGNKINYLKPAHLERVRAKKLRGMVSYGMLVKAPDGARVGDNVATLLGVQHYEPEMEVAGSREDNTNGPKIIAPTYDVDAMLRYAASFNENEEVVATLKIHGSNMRAVYHDGQMYIGSRNMWKMENYGNNFWRVTKYVPQILEFCKANPDHILYGEVYGFQKKGDVKFTYDCKVGELGFRAFDVMLHGNWHHYDESEKLLQQYNVPQVPVLYRGPFNLDKMKELAVGNDILGHHLREGVCVKPVLERWDARIGRVHLKLVSYKYLEL